MVWWLGTHPNAELLARINAFVDRAQRDGTLLKIEDRYFGHVRRLKQADIVTFLGRVETVLPKLRKHFQAAQMASGIDWRLIAAVAYHESHWDAQATSPTGVRGIMMLTEDTADRLGVGNRLDARESIMGGARYLNLLKEMQPEDVAEPDRTWLALASYNIGPGHFNAARALAKLQGADPTAWYEMKQILPLLARPKYYEKVKSGRARGGEAVLLVENIRAYYDILARNQPAYIAGFAAHGRHDRHAGQQRSRPETQALSLASPPMYGRSTAGTVTLPSAFWKFSRMATSVRPTASPEPLSVWHSSFLFLSLRKRVCMRRAWKAPKLEHDEISR